MSRRRAHLAVVALLLAACSGSVRVGSSTTAPTLSTTTTQASTSSTAAGSGTAPGDLVSTNEVRNAAVADVRVWKVAYHSRSISDADITVTGLVLAPSAAPPAGGYPVVSWAHGTTGSADTSAPSTMALTVPLLAPLAKAGYVVAATDYEGLGSPGPHPYLVGESEGRGVLDAARAAQRLSDAHAGPTVLIFGHSQGGQAALFAGQLAPTYAPDLHVAGVVAAAPAGELAALMGGAANYSAAVGFLVATGYAWSKTYPDVDLGSLLTDQGVQAAGVVEQECITEVITRFAGKPAADWVRPGALQSAPWPELMERNTPGREGTAIPVLVVQGQQDQLVPAASTTALVNRMCGLGDDVQLTTYPSADHISVIQASASDVLAFFTSRVGQAPTAPNCGR